MTFRATLHSTLTMLLLGGISLSTGSCSDGGQPGEEEIAAHEGEAAEEQHAEEHEKGLVELKGAKANAAGLETVTVSMGSLPAQLETTGQVDFNQDRLAHVSPRIPGRVHDVRARLGQRVRKGEVLAVLDSIELGRAKAGYLQAKARQQLTRETFTREEELYADRISSEQEMLAAKAAHIEAEADLRNAEETLHLYGLGEAEVAAVTYENPGRSLFPIRAPLSGKVVEKHVTVGELVTPERNLFTLADLSEVWIWIDVYERDLSNVHLDDEVHVQVDAFPDRDFEGRVSYQSDQVDTDTRTIRARIDVPNPNGELRPGMFARVELTDPHQAQITDQSPAVLVIPESALQRNGAVTIVFVDEGDGRFRRREVQIGRRAGGLAEVLAGLETGDGVVSEGAFFLKSELSKDELGEGHGH
jgi:cobalt-zinc-cadmium efflux system membrane fusion protein